MKELVIRAIKHRRICSVRGCGNRDTVMIARSADMAGGLFMCRDCAEELYNYYFPPVEAADETPDETADAVTPAAEEAKTAEKKPAEKKAAAKK